MQEGKCQKRDPGPWKGGRANKCRGNPHQVFVGVSMEVSVTTGTGTQHRTLDRDTPLMLHGRLILISHARREVK